MGKLFEGVIVGWLVSLALTIPAVLIPFIRIPALFIGGFVGGMKEAEERTKRIKLGLVTGLFIAVLNVLIVFTLIAFSVEPLEFIVDAAEFTTSLVFGLLGIEIVAGYLWLYMLVADSICTCAGGVIGSVFASKAPVKSKEKIEVVPKMVPTTATKVVPEESKEEVEAVPDIVPTTATKVVPEESKEVVESVPETVPTTAAKVVPVPETVFIYNFNNSLILLEERKKAVAILKGLDGRLEAGELKEETHDDLRPKYVSKVEDIHRKIKSELERATTHLQQIEEERTKLQHTQEALNAELILAEEKEKKAEISARINGFNAELERVDGIIRTMKEKIGVIEGEISGD
jgi:hypothetical protein